jgi:hypothetical protein
MDSNVASSDSTECRSRPTLRKDTLEDEVIPQDWLIGKLLHDLEPKKELNYQQMEKFCVRSFI